MAAEQEEGEDHEKASHTNPEAELLDARIPLHPDGNVKRDKATDNEGRNEKAQGGLAKPERRTSGADETQ